MKTATMLIESLPGSFYSQSRVHEAPRLEGEKDDVYDKRTARSHLHVNGEGNVIIPATCFKKAITEAATYSKRKIRGQGQATYGQKFRAGIVIPTDMDLGIAAADVPVEPFFLDAVPSKKGSGRVWRHYPMIGRWRGRLEIIILDSIIDEAILVETVDLAGLVVGIGRWRPANGGMNGRFQIVPGSFELK